MASKLSQRPYEASDLKPIIMLDKTEKCVAPPVGIEPMTPMENFGARNRPLYSVCDDMRALFVNQMLALNHLSSRLLSARTAHAETQQRLQFLDQGRIRDSRAIRQMPK